MNNKRTITYPDYNKIKLESQYIDHSISEADFFTSHPNPYRISYTASDIHRYLKYKRKIIEER